MNAQDVVEILLVEDDPDDVKLVLHSFKKFGLTNKVHVVTDGAAALDYIFCAGAYASRSINDPPKVVLLDIKLPKVNGLEVLRRIRDDPQTSALPVVLLTSSREDRDVAEGYRNHANSYVVKPVDFESFADAIKNLGFYWLLLNTTPPRAADPGTAGGPATEEDSPVEA